MKRTFVYEQGLLTVKRLHEGGATTEKKYRISFNEVWFVSFLGGNLESLSGYYFPMEQSGSLVTLLDPRMEAEFRVALVEIATFTKPAFERLKDADEFERAWDLFYKIQNVSYAEMENAIANSGLAGEHIALLHANEHLKLRAQIALGYGENV